MSVANIHTLRKLAKENNLLGKNYDPNNFQPSSYDLRIGTIYQRGKIFSESQALTPSPYIKVKPSEIITFHTLEDIHLPNNYCGTVFALNSQSSTGLLILNPGHIDPGFEGPVSICAINMSNEPIKVRLNDKIFTLILMKLDEELSKEDSYNKPFDIAKRKEFEDKYFTNRFSNLSNSIFDLVLDYNKANKFLIDRIYERFKNIIKSWTNMLVLVFSLLGGFYLLFPKSIIFNLDSKKSTEINVLKDSINSINLINKEQTNILQLKLDSINLYNKK